jgi:hypothetical protein
LPFGSIANFAIRIFTGINITNGCHLGIEIAFIRAKAAAIAATLVMIPHTVDAGNNFA